MDVSIIIVNYKTKELTQNCIRSIIEKTYGVEYEIIVVDNQSNDGSVPCIAAQFPQITIIESTENLGFGRANNLGANHAKGEYLFFLNSDTLLLNNAVKIFYDYFEKESMERMAAAGTILWDEWHNNIHSYGTFPSIKSELVYIYHAIKRENANKYPTIPLFVDYISGADLFVKHKVFDELDGFDHRIFMYYEETDLQKRMSDANYSRVIIPGPQIIHLEGGSFQKKGLSLHRFIMSQTSYNYYIKKHYKGLQYILFRCFMVIYRLSLFFHFNGSFKDRIKAYKTIFQ